MIHKGDIVWLKSGGPAMTASEICSNGICKCLWFLHGQIQIHDFDSKALTKEDPFFRKKDNLNDLDNLKIEI